MAVSAYDRHDCDIIVGEKNFGGDMVRFVIQTAKAGVPYKAVNASRGKHVRAEPVAALHEQDKIKFVGYFDKLEEEMASMSTHGYIGEDSPNRVDAFVWLITELFPGVVKEKSKPKPPPIRSYGSYMS